MLSYNLDGLGQLRKIDPVTVLTGWRRMGGSASNALTADDAREVGRRLASRYVVTGRAVQLGADVQLIAEVQDVESGRVRGAVRVTGPADSASSLVDELTLELLRGNLLPTDGKYPLPSLSRATTSSLPALKEYLAGEREYRRGQWSEAVRYYQRAVEADSTFASGWFRLAGACGWGGCPIELREGYYQRALKLADRLPDRDAKRIRAAGDVEALEAFTAAYPDDLEAWIALGESYFHHFGGATLRSTEAYSGRVHSGGAAVSLLWRGLPAPDRGRVSAPRQSRRPTSDRRLRRPRRPPRLQLPGELRLGLGQRCGARASHGRARHRGVGRVRDDTAGRAAGRPRSHGADLCRRGGHGHPGGLSNVCALRAAPVPRPERPDLGGPTRAGPAGRRTHNQQDSPRSEIQLHLSGFPDSATARRAARVLATQGAPTDYFWIGALAISEGRWTDVEPVRRALERQTQSVEAGGSPPGATPAHTRGRWGPTRGSSEAIAPGWRDSTRLWFGFQCSAMDIRTAADVSPLPGRQAAVR